MKKALLLFGILLLSIRLSAQEYPVESDPGDILNKSSVTDLKAGELAEVRAGELTEVRSSDILAQPDGDDLLGDITDNSKAEPLLPQHILFTQRMLWGKKGIMRLFNYFELTPEKRARELKLRRIMLTTHQIVGFATLAAMVAQGIVGSNLYNISVLEKEGDLKQAKSRHNLAASIVNWGYFTTAGLAFFTPPKMVDNKKGYSSVKLHAGLAIVHLAGMITTNLLVDQIEVAKDNARFGTGTYGRVHDLKVYHRAAAFTAFGSYAAAMIALSF